MQTVTENAPGTEPNREVTVGLTTAIELLTTAIKAASMGCNPKSANVIDPVAMAMSKIDEIAINYCTTPREVFGPDEDKPHWLVEWWKRARHSVAA